MAGSDRWHLSQGPNGVPRDPGLTQRLRVRVGDSVELLGEVDQSRLRQLYAESDVLVHPSQVELLPDGRF